jgi:hypothetical protein
MVSKVLAECDPLLTQVAMEVCDQVGLNIADLSSYQVRGLINYWCLTCNKVYPLTDLRANNRRKECCHCLEAVKLRGASNKFGKIRRTIFFRLLSRN